MGEDPARDGGNWYAYCGGNPVMNAEYRNTSVGPHNHIGIVEALIGNTVFRLTTQQGGKRQERHKKGRIEH
jgi:hypothetical protein